ncbi:MAG: hypothetical protein ACXVDC_12970, partial [Bacteroidia bacterium]
DGKGRLLADTSFKITKQQLAKWTVVEDSLTKKILTRLIYPPFLNECGMVGQIIISFTVDKKGMFNDFRLEKYDSKMSKDSLCVDIKEFTEAGFGSTIFFSGNFTKQGFNAAKQSEKYYLPITFTINPDNTVRHAVRQTKNGWLTIEMEQIIPPSAGLNDPRIDILKVQVKPK